MDYGEHRWTVDTPEDYAMMQTLFQCLESPLTVSWQQVLDVIEHHPDMEKINAASKAKDVKIIDERS